MKPLATCTLRAAGYTLTIRFAPVTDPGYVSGVGRLAIQGGDDDAEALALQFRLHFPLWDLPNFAAYFEEHVANLLESAQSSVGGTVYRDAPAFVDLDANFEMQALAGRVSGETEGAFPLRVMVPVETAAPPGVKPMMVGAQAEVELGEVRRFVVALRAVDERINQSF